MSLIAYTGDEPLSLEEVKVQCRVDSDDEDGLIEDAIIPAARAMAEARTGCAIREATYQDYFEDVAECVLSMGGVISVESVEVDGEEVEFTDVTIARRTYVHVESASGKPGMVTYKAGSDIDKHPGARAWMLLTCGWLYAQRELLSDGVPHDPPRHIHDSLLASLNVQPGF